MLIGVLRWREAHQRGGIWWVLYKQVVPSYPAGATLIYKLMPAIGLGMDCCSYTRRSASCSEYIYSSTDFAHMAYGWHPGFRYSGFKRCVNFSTMQTFYSMRNFCRSHESGTFVLLTRKRFLNSAINANVDVPDSST